MESSVFPVWYKDQLEWFSKKILNCNRPFRPKHWWKISKKKLLSIWKARQINENDIFSDYQDSKARNKLKFFQSNTPIQIRSSVRLWGKKLRLKLRTNREKLIIKSRSGLSGFCCRDKTDFWTASSSTFVKPSIEILDRKKSVKTEKREFEYL